VKPMELARPLALLMERQLYTPLDNIIIGFST